MPKTPRRTVRVPDEVWEAARKKADRFGTTISEVVRKSLEHYLRGRRR